MAEPWRTPHPYQQNPEDQPVFQYQQQAPGVMGPPRPPPPPYPVGSRLVPLCNPGEGVQTGGRRSSNPYMMTPQQVFTAVLDDPAPARTIRQLLMSPIVPSHADNPQEGANPEAESSTWGVQAPVDPVPGNPNPPYSQLEFMQNVAGAQGPSTSRAGAREVQTPTSPQMPCQSGCLPCQYRGCDDTSSVTDEDTESLSYSPTTPDPPPEPAKQQRSARGRLLGPAPVQPLHTYMRNRLQDEYDIVPEFVEANLWLLPEGKAKTKQDREIEAVLRNQFHAVGQGPYRMLMRSLPPVLREKMRRIRRDTYAIRKGENHVLSRQQQQHTARELLKLRAQLKEMTESRDTLMAEVSLLRGKVAVQHFLSHKD